MAAAQQGAEEDERVPLRGASGNVNGYPDSEAATADEEDPFVEVVEGVEGYSPRIRSSQGSDDESKNGVVKASGNLFIAVVGAGVLGLPYAFRQSGLALGAGFLILVAAIALYCMLLLVRCKRALEEHGVVSYGEVTRHTLGRSGQRLVDTLLIISQTGFCIAYLVFIKANIASLLPVPGNLVIAALLAPLIGLAMLRNVAALAPFSLAADIAMISGFAVVLFDDALQLARHRPPIQAATGWACLPYLFGVAIYCFEGVGMILPIEASMHTPRHFDAVLAGTMSAVTALYVGFGSVGYLAFGEATHDIITFNLPPGWSTPAVKAALCIGLFLTFPPMMIPVYEILERSLSKKAWFKQRFPHQRKWVAFRSIRSAIVLGAALMAMFVPGFGAFISLIGSLACALLAFVIPAFCHLRIFGAELPRWQYGLDVAMVAFGSVGAVVGTTDSVIKLIRHASG